MLFESKDKEIAFSRSKTQKVDERFNPLRIGYSPINSVWNRLRDTELVDTMIKDGLWDAFHGYHMGITAENVAEKFQVTREEQDKFALNSQEKALKAQKENKFKEEIINFKIKSKKNEIDFNKDEHPREEINLEALRRLKPVFKKDGTVTAGNASGINDGAAAATLMSAEEAEKRQLQKLVSIKSWASCGVDPALMGTGPIPASKKALPIFMKKVPTPIMQNLTISRLKAT